MRSGSQKGAYCSAYDLISVDLLGSNREAHGPQANREWIGHAYLQRLQWVWLPSPGRQLVAASFGLHAQLLDEHTWGSV